MRNAESGLFLVEVYYYYLYKYYYKYITVYIIYYIIYYLLYILNYTYFFGGQNVLMSTFLLSYFLTFLVEDASY